MFRAGRLSGPTGSGVLLGLSVVKAIATPVTGVVTIRFPPWAGVGHRMGLPPVTAIRAPEI